MSARASRRLVVSKFGGSSCGNADAYRRLGHYFTDQLEAGHQSVGVFSAMFAVTDRLLNAIEFARNRDAVGVAKSRSEVFDLHSRTARDLLGNRGNIEETEDWIDQRLQRYFDTTLARVSENGRATAYDRDCVAHLGERLSIKLIHEHCQEIGLPSALCESDELLVTTDESSNAEPILHLTEEKVNTNLKPLLDEGKIPMISGYFGRSADGKLTTLGRGGTDLTAAVMGYALDADEIALYKVEYTTTEDGWLKDWQPGWIGIVHDAATSVTIPEMSYGIAAQLAHFGKKVLHPSTVYPAVRKSIPIYVKNNYDHAHAGTKIMDGNKINLDHRVTSITSMSVDAYEQKYSVSIGVRHPKANEDATKVPQSAANVEYNYQQFLREAQRIQRQRVLEHHPDSFQLDIRDLQDRLKEIAANSAQLVPQELQGDMSHTAGQDGTDIGTAMSAPPSIHDLSNNLSFVTLVGPGISESHTIMRKARLRLRKHGIPNSIPRNVRASEDHICLIVESEHRKRAVEALHYEFVGRYNTSVGVDRNREKLSSGKYYLDMDNFTPVYGKNIQADAISSSSAAY